jgi:hypothetical protein
MSIINYGNYANKLMDQIQSIYLEFLANFPVQIRPVVSIALAVLLVYSLFKVLKKDWIFLIALLILLPTSKSILQSIWEGIVAFIQFLLKVK